jgi:hypothetical protein
VCRPKHVKQLRNIGIINSTTRLHLGGSFYEFYITIHGSMNIKFVTGNFIPSTEKLVFADSPRGNVVSVPMFVFIIHAEQNPTRLESASYSWLSTASN